MCIFVGLSDVDLGWSWSVCILFITYNLDLFQSVFVQCLCKTCELIIFALGPVAPTTIKSRFNWTAFTGEWRFEPSSTHI